MKVKELIEKLSKIDPEANVFVESSTGDFDEDDEEIMLLEPVRGIHTIVKAIGKTCCIAV